MNKSSTNKGNKSRSSPSTKVTKKRRQGSRKSNKQQQTIGGFPVNTVPTAYVSRMNVSKPKVFSTSKSVIHSRTELVSANVDTGNQANVFQSRGRYRINPGSQRTFPWLSNIAKCYESYRFKSLKFHYITRANTTREGTLYLSPDYDAADAEPTEEAVIANNDGAKEGSLFQNLTVFFKPEKMNRLFKAHTCMDDARFDATSQDEKTIDCAQLFIAMETPVVSTKVGKLMVEYVVELFEPQQPFIPSSQGGALEIFPGSLANSLTPVAGVPVLQSAVGLPPLLTQTFGQTYPSDVMGTFTRDFQGFINLLVDVSGGNLTNYPVMAKNNVNMVTAGGAGINSSNAEVNYLVNAVAGDQLKLGPMNITAGALAQVRALFGATGFLA